MSESASVPCPNCCRRAPVIARQHGLLFYRCDLCESSGAVPEEESPEE